MKTKLSPKQRIQIILLLLLIAYLYQHLRGLRCTAPAAVHSPRSIPLNIFESGSEAASNASRQRVKAFIGVQTGFTAPESNQKYNYELRREQLRATWFPGNRHALQRLEQEQGIVARFVVGHSDQPGPEAAMQAEMQRHGDFLQLDVTEAYLDLAKKTLAFISSVARLYVVDYVIKVDDDVFLRLDRVPAVLRQWRKLGADYVGCMKTGAIMTSPKYRWYEPQHVLLGSKTYFAHTWGSVYVLSGSAATFLSSIPPEALRYFSNEDVTVGSWMLAFNVTHYDDRRMCEPACSGTSVAVYDFPKCAGLCDAVTDLPLLWKSGECQAAPLEPPLRPQSWLFP